MGIMRVLQRTISIYTKGERRVGVQKKERENYRNVGLKVFLRREQHRLDGEKKNRMILCFGREGKGPQLVVMVAGATHLSNHVSEPTTTRGSAACLWSRREPKGARLISAQQ